MVNLNLNNHLFSCRSLINYTYFWTISTLCRNLSMHWVIPIFYLDIDGNADPSYKDGFKRCIDETANVILNTPVPEEIKQHFITQLKVLSLGQENYSPLTPEYERNDLNKYNNLTNSGGMSLFPAVSPHSANTSPLHINSSHFDSDRQSAFNAVESRTVIKQEVHSPEQNSKVNGIWRPW